ncbi:hypothetical protein VTK73DRAFT_7105 [Phialemonium thermophilum]|uniref:Uncharacterized protein n=1 Tax=Phialemonium thermophilum TaxID=223376 RepID=A0ABR3XUG6_9PEZI
MRTCSWYRTVVPDLHTCLFLAGRRHEYTTASWRRYLRGGLAPAQVVSLTFPIHPNLTHVCPIGCASISRFSLGFDETFSSFTDQEHTVSICALSL